MGQMERTARGANEKVVDMPADEKLQRLQEILREMGSVVVAYSGGVDSAFLLRVASDTLGAGALGAIADSESLPRQELDEALDLARQIGVPVDVIRTQEVGRDAYRANGPDRCYHCKTELFEHLAPLARRRGFAHVVYGANLDDLRDVRPGAKAAREHHIRAPLVEVGLSKQEIRDLSRELGLPTWDKPSFACLSSRIPYGTPVTVEVLARIEAAEGVLRALGFRQQRVRHHDTIARVELGVEEIERLLDPAVREQVVSGLKRLGYTYVTLDLAGYRSGSMNEGLRQPIPLKVVG